MPLAFDAVSSGEGSGAGPFSFSHTTSGADRLLLVLTMVVDTIDTVSSVTYNSVGLTAIPSFATANGLYRVAGHYLVAPATGANTVSVSVTGGVNDFGAMAISFTGAHQTVPLGTAANATGSSTTPSVNVSSAADEIVVDMLNIVHSGALTVGAGQTQRVSDIGPNGFAKYAGSTEPGSATTTMSWSHPSSSQTWAIGAVPVKPAAAAGQPTTKRGGGVPGMYGNPQTSWIRTW